MQLLNLYAIYAHNGTINILLPFTDLLCNAQPYVAHPASFLSHLHLQSWGVSSSLYLLFIKANTYLSYNLRYYLQYTSSPMKLRLTILGQLQLEFKSSFLVWTHQWVVLHHLKCSYQIIHLRRDLPKLLREHIPAEVISIWARIGKLCRIAGNESSWQAVALSLDQTSLGNA